jgi:hypothetical protein
MTSQWVNPLIRGSIYVYFAFGTTLLFNSAMDSALRYGDDKRIPALFLLGQFGGILLVLAVASWNAFQRPVSGRKWILLCLLSSLGILQLLSAPTSNGGGALGL